MYWNDTGWCVAYIYIYIYICLQCCSLCMDSITYNIGFGALCRSLLSWCWVTFADQSCSCFWCQFLLRTVIVVATSGVGYHTWAIWQCYWVCIWSFYRSSNALVMFARLSSSMLSLSRSAIQSPSQSKHVYAGCCDGGVARTEGADCLIWWTLWSVSPSVVLWIRDCPFWMSLDATDVWVGITTSDGE